EINAPPLSLWLCQTRSTKGESDARSVQWICSVITYSETGIHKLYWFCSIWMETRRANLRVRPACLGTMRMVSHRLRMSRGVHLLLSFHQAAAEYRAKRSDRARIRRCRFPALCLGHAGCRAP